MMFFLKIAWIAHRTMRGPRANWQHMYSAAEGDMLREISESAKAKEIQHMHPADSNGP